MDAERQKKLGICLLLALLLILSVTVLNQYFTNLDHYEKTIATLDENANTVMELIATSTATSTAITFLPGDIATPIAEKLADVSSYFVIVLCAIYLEKFILAVVGYVCFRGLFPLAFVFFGIFQWTKRNDFKRLAIKSLCLGFLLICVVPASTWVSNVIQTTYESSISETLAMAKEANQELEETIEANSNQESEDTSEKEETSKKAGTETEEKTTEKSEEESTGSSLIGKIGSFLSGVGESASDYVSETVSGVTDSVTGYVKEQVEQMKNLLNYLLQSLALMVVTSCLIPILVLLFFFWLIKLVIEFATTEVKK